MTYHIYTTDSIVLSYKPQREADRIYTILTRDLGLIRAIAHGVRKESSKLRAALEPYSFSSVSLVKGKALWRVTNATLSQNLRIVLGEKKEVFKAFARALGLLSQLIIGEEKHREIHDDIEKVSRFVKNEKLDDNNAEAIEILLVLKILYELGYASEEEVSKNVLKAYPSSNVLEEIEASKKELVQIINHGLKVSHLT